MEAGELELRQAFEETATRNIKAVVEHGNDTRKLVRDLEAKLEHLEKVVRDQNQQIDTLRRQLVTVQAKLYA